MLSSLALLSRARGRVCALPLQCVLEIMRPLAIESFSEMPSFLLGMSVIRGQLTPVVALMKLLGDEKCEAMTRFVLLRVENRTVALAVDSVCGIHDIQNLQLQEMPPLLRDTHTEIIEAIGILDAQLLVVLRAARILPEEVWQTLAAREVS